jgi:hypothetical protein
MAEIDFERVRDNINRNNWQEVLADVPCPECGAFGVYQVFHEANNNGVGLRCLNCDKRHPFQQQRIMWLRGDEPRRSNDIAAVARECGEYCYICGATFDELRAQGIGLHVHHTRPFIDHGEAGKKIPLCADCHEFANLMQRMRRRKSK